MPRNVSGVFSLVPGTAAVSGDTIRAADYNALTQDIAADLNAPRPVTSGGTGATNTGTARSNLGATTVGDALFIAADATAAKTTLALEQVDNTSDSAKNSAVATLTNKTLTSPTINGGTISGITDLAVADGGTGASDAAGARANLGLGNVATKDVGVAAGNVPLLDGAGKLADAGGVAVILDVAIAGIEGTHPFVARADDVEQHGRDLHAQAVAGDFGPVAAYVEPPATIPPEVTRAQAKIALLRAGLLDQVEAAVSAAGGEVAIWYADALNWRRDNPYIASLGAAVGLTDAQVDDLFATAAAIQA